MKIFVAAVLISLALLVQEAVAGEYLIKIDLEQRQLRLLEGDLETAVFPIAVPRRDLKQLPWKGIVTAIEKNPCWYPTKATRNAYFKEKKMELPRFLSYGDPRNAMGKGKIIIQFSEPVVENPIRIHGTNDESSIGQRITRGCLRLHNKDILQLIDLIQEKTVRVLVLSQGGSAAFFIFK